MYWLYNLISAAGMILLLPYFLVRGIATGKYLHNIRERLGEAPADFPARTANTPGAIWLHCVSVGESLAAIPLARQLKERFPGKPLVISTTTDTGQRLARQRMGFADGFFYFPLDWPGPVRRVLRRVRPSLVVVLETEIWPNFLRECRRASVPVVFANGRISKKSFHKYQWANDLTHGFLADVLQDPALFLMQSQVDARRVQDLGAPEEAVEVSGNLKFDLAPPDAGPVVTWLGEHIERQERWPVIVAGSVLEGEEQQVLAAFDIVQRKWRRALLILAPRKPERFDAAAEAARRDGWNVVSRRQVRLDTPLPEDADVFLLDTFGELAGVYRLAEAVFVGGSLVAAGGHNILEPAWFSKPPIFGPSMENFREMADLFLEEMAGQQVYSAEQLGNVWVDLIGHDDRRERMGRAARELVERNRGATARSVERIAKLVGSCGGAA